MGEKGLKARLKVEFGVKSVIKGFNLANNKARRPTRRGLKR